MNLIEIMGIVGTDPEERTTPSGSKVVSFRIADNIRRGAQGEETIWWRVTVWGDQFDRMMPYIKKGSALIVHGEIRKKPDVYQDREGQTQVSMEVTATQLRFSPFGRSQQQEGSSGQTSATSYGQAAGYATQEASVSGGMQGGGMQAAGTTMTPGGFKPAVGGGAADDFSEDHLPF